MIVYIEILMGFIFKKLLEPIIEFCKVAGYKISIQNSTAFMYASNEKLEVDLKTNAS